MAQAAPEVPPPASLPCRLAGLLDRYYLVPMAVLGALVASLNYRAKGMQGLLRHYDDYRRIILAGLDPSAAAEPGLTFPMWGYGWLRVLTRSKPALLGIQHALALAAAGAFTRLVEQDGWLSRRGARIFKVLLMVSIPWYALHSLLWPYSPAVSLYVAAGAAFLHGLRRPVASVGPLAAAGLLLGAALNLRSEHILLAPAMALVVLVTRGWTRRSVAGALALLATTYAMLVPWALYARRATGHYLLTSTNGGQVLFIGLGNLPGNRWGITPVDGDPLMNRLVRERLGPGVPPYHHRADRLLRREYLLRVRAHPGEYGRRLLHVARRIVTGGPYEGEFYEEPRCEPRCSEKMAALRPRLLAAPLGGLLRLAREEPRLAVMLASGVIGHASVLVSFALLPVLAVRGWRRRDPLLLLSSTAIAYQAMVNLLAFHMSSYTSNVLFFHLLNLAVALAGATGRAARRRAIVPQDPG